MPQPPLFDITPFSLPNCAEGDIRFEEPREITRLVARFVGRAPARVGVSYLRKHWPEQRLGDGPLDQENPCAFGWVSNEDWFNGQWQRAAVRTRRLEARTVEITFRSLSVESPGFSAFDFQYRRTVGLRIEHPGGSKIAGVSVFTRSDAMKTRVRVELDAGRRTRGRRIMLSGYNAKPLAVAALRGVRKIPGGVRLGVGRQRCFEFSVRHMRPRHRFCNDDGHLTFTLDHDIFTISLGSLLREGPIWFAEEGIYIALADDPTTFAAYRLRNANARTIAEQVMARGEQTLAGAMLGQPNPHPVSFSFGCTLSPQRFWLEPSGDLVLHRWPVVQPPAVPNLRYRNSGDARFFFGLERWADHGRFTDPPPVLAYNIHVRQENLLVEQKSFAAPLGKSILDGPLDHSDTIVAMMRFTLRNAGPKAIEARLPLGYSSNSYRSMNPRQAPPGKQDEFLVPLSTRESLSVSDGRVTGRFEGKRVLRAVFDSSMLARKAANGIVFFQQLQPGESCQLILKIPYVAVDRAGELAALAAMDFDKSYAAVEQFWRQECARGAQIQTPDPDLNALYLSHPAHVQLTDLLMPDGSGLVNTSVGTNSYGNYSNEACMIVRELDGRGLAEDARRRLDLWVKYQGTVPQPGNFTDCDGMYYGAAGFERGSYNQHHGWVLWCLAEHYLLTRDRAWLQRTASSMIAGADWIFRQRRNTSASLPHSRGWEHGFLPAGSLEDVTDFHYWLSTNVLTWRGADRAASALESMGHPEAPRLRREADAYAADLRRGFETMRQHSPLVRLRDGRWVPHYPSRLYWRGRDLGWIRETLEGSVYLLISGLYPCDGKEAQWILDDYHDNRYTRPPNGYAIADFTGDWFNRGGFSIQPNLLAGLMPHLDRDEPEVYLWMFFNAWAACYRPQIGAMVEHPYPYLGYSNCGHFKTSDQANAVAWLSAMFVYTAGDTLHLGRALPRQWFEDGCQIRARDIQTCFGRVGVEFDSSIVRGRIDATINLDLHTPPDRMLVRFRHPKKTLIGSATVNGRPVRFDAERGDVDVSGTKGKLRVRVHY